MRRLGPSRGLLPPEGGCRTVGSGWPADFLEGKARRDDAAPLGVRRRGRLKCLGLLRGKGKRGRAASAEVLRSVSSEALQSKNPSPGAREGF